MIVLPVKEGCPSRMIILNFILSRKCNQSVYHQNIYLSVVLISMTLQYSKPVVYTTKSGKLQGNGS